MSLSSIATKGYLTGDPLGCIATKGFLCGAVALPTPIPVPPIPSSGGGRYGPGYTGNREDALKETRRSKILTEDDEIIAIVMSMITEGLL